MIWLVGAGTMAREYAQVLRSLSLEFTIIGRGEERVRALATEFGMPYLHGGLNSAIEQATTPPVYAIVALPVSELYAAAQMLSPLCKAILLEKPGAMEASEMQNLADIATAEKAANIFIAYNRRFLSSIVDLRERLKKEGPVLSAIVEFDEPAAQIERLPTDSAIKARWGFANASHVFDLLWYLCGPSIENFIVADANPASVSWHPAGAVYVGAGRTEIGTKYVYHGNYASAGRWRLTLSLAAKRYILSPLEALRMVESTSVVEHEIVLPPNPYPDLKPGLRDEVEAFFGDNPDGLLPDASYQARHMSFLATVFGYPL